MTAELAKPDSMGDLDQDEDEEEEEEAGGGGGEEEGPGEPRVDDDQVEDKGEAEERESLLTGDQKEKSSPSIQLVAGGGEAALARTPAVTGTSIKVAIEQGHSPRYIPHPSTFIHISAMYNIHFCPF